MDGETAVVTGASRGVGAAVARRFAGAVADQFRWAAGEADPDTVDGAVLDRRDWREATR